MNSEQLRIKAVELALQLFSSHSGSISSIGATEKSKTEDQLIIESKKIYKFITTGE